MPPLAPVLFASDFPALTDCEWGYPLGGWGGIKRGAPLRHTPVVFVHGNQADAENWYLVADQFKQLAGFSDQEMYALSYNGLGNAYAGMPTRSQPAAESMSYWQGTNPPLQAFANGGKGASDDPNVPDLYNFVRAVQDYTGSRRVDIVAHLLRVRGDRTRDWLVGAAQRGGRGARAHPLAVDLQRDGQYRPLLSAGPRRLRRPAEPTSRWGSEPHVSRPLPQ
jgi:hypothetical protein